MPARTTLAMKSTDLIRQTYAGKTIGRILGNWAIARECRNLSGSVVDLAAGGSPSYYRYLPKGLVLTRTDVHPGPGIDRIVDLNEPLPFKDGEFDAALMFGALYILEDPLRTLREVRRILAPRGSFYLALPFLLGEIPEPHDYGRWTGEGLERLLRQAGFVSVRIVRVGGPFTAAANLLHAYLYFDTVRLAVSAAALACDRLARAVRPKLAARSPISYLCIAAK